jgi:hypothetical protein
MRQIIEFSQIDFFKKNRYLELDGLFKSNDFETITMALHALNPPKSSASADLHNCYLNIPLLKRWLIAQPIAQILYDLSGLQQFRLLFDQVIEYPLYPKSPSSLVLDQLSFQGVVMGLLININGFPVDGHPLFPSHKSHVTFFDPTLMIDLQPFKTPTGSKFLCVGFGTLQTRYRFEPTDPHTHDLKKLGYVFGDVLDNRFHPVFFKKT